MTAKALASRALEAGQTLSLCGEDQGATRVLLEALGLIAKYGNCIPNEPKEKGAKLDALG